MFEKSLKFVLNMCQIPNVCAYICIFAEVPKYVQICTVKLLQEHPETLYRPVAEPWGATADQ